jgi:uncharacterized membrane protein
MMRFLSKTFLGGLVVIVPIALTLYLLWSLGSAAERGLGWLLGLGLPERLYVPGMGLFLGILLVLAAGIVMRAWFVRQLLVLVERLVHRVPLLGAIYGSLKDLMAFVGGQKKWDVQAVTVSVGDSDLRLLGLLTRESAADLTANEQDRDCASVYLPMSYALGGFMVLAPRTSVTPLAMSAKDTLRVVLTAGMSAEEAGPQPTSRSRSGARSADVPGRSSL